GGVPWGGSDVRCVEWLEHYRRSGCRLRRHDMKSLLIQFALTTLSRLTQAGLCGFSGRRAASPDQSDISKPALHVRLLSIGLGSSARLLTVPIFPHPRHVENGIFRAKGVDRDLVRVGVDANVVGVALADHQVAAGARSAVHEGMANLQPR